MKRQLGSLIVAVALVVGTLSGASAAQAGALSPRHAVSETAPTKIAATTCSDFDGDGWQDLVVAAPFKMIDYV